jgi:DNA-binding NarL/FixJ family response regulator
MRQGRVLLIHSQLPLPQSLRTVLTEASQAAVAEAGNALDGVRQALCLQPECVVVDMSMVDEDGLALGQLIHQLLPESKVVLLVYDPATDCPRALVKGIAACIDKCAAPQEVALVLGKLLESPP